MQNVTEVLKVKVLLLTLKSDGHFNLSLWTFFNNMIICFVWKILIQLIKQMKTRHSIFLWNVLYKKGKSTYSTWLNALC